MSAMLKSRLWSMGFALALLGLAWWYLKLHPVLGGSIAGVIVLSHLLPAKWDDFGSGVGFAIVACVVYFYFGNQTQALLLGAIGAFYLFSGVRALPRTPQR